MLLKYYVELNDSFVHLSVEIVETERYCTEWTM